MYFIKTRLLGKFRISSLNLAWILIRAFSYEAWVKVPAGKTVDRKGQPLMIKLKGKVEAFYK